MSHVFLGHNVVLDQDAVSAVLLQAHWIVADTRTIRRRRHLLLLAHRGLFLTHADLVRFVLWIGKRHLPLDKLLFSFGKLASHSASPYLCFLIRLHAALRLAF